MSFLRSMFMDVDPTPSLNFPPSIFGGDLPDIASWGLGGKFLQGTLEVLEEASQNQSKPVEITGDVAFDKELQMILDGDVQQTQPSTGLAILPQQNQNYLQQLGENIEPPQTSDVVLLKQWNASSQQQIKEEEFDLTFNEVNPTNQNILAELTAQTQKLENTLPLIQQEIQKVPTESSEQKYTPRENIDMEGDTPLHILVVRCEGRNKQTRGFGLSQRNNYENDQARKDFFDKAHLYKQYVNRQNNDGMTPLHYAVEIGCPQMVHKLLQLGSCLNRFNNRLESPIHVALRQRKDSDLYNFTTMEHLKQIVEQLLRANQARYGDDHMDLNKKDKNGLTCVHLACLYANHEATNLVNLLKCYGADLDEKEDRQGFTPLQFIINKGKDCNLQKPEGIKQRNAYFKTAKHLITQQKVDVTSLSMAEDTALHLACAANDKGLVELLLGRDEIEVNLKNAFKKNEKDLTDDDQIKEMLEVKYRQKRRKRKNNEQGVTSGKAKKAK
ncbi:uncharacterized protein [Clytia hemisphaerica]|uniref:Uncharacterized protein n=1 Tax=Clytia hemisphaerica TaxID=252671 RepID=A0A7M5U496_9CNID